MIRGLLRNTLIIAAFMTLFSACNNSVKEDIGIQLWSVREDMKRDADGTIEQLGAMGYSFVEAAGYGNGQFYGMAPLEFKELLNQHGLEFTASHCGQALPDADKWEETMAWWDQCIAAHAEAGVKYIVQPFMDNKGYSSLEDLQRYCDYFNAVGEKCNAQGIRFGYHNHDKEFESEQGVVRYDYMLQHTDPEKVMFQMDLYWIMKGNKEALAYFEAYPGRFELLHVKDEKELGESGQMDFKPIFERLDQAGTKKLIVEVERYNHAPLESVKRSLDYLHNSGVLN